MVNTTFPILLLAGAAPTGDSVTKGSFQQLDQVVLLQPHTKLALRPPTVRDLPNSIRDAYRAAFYGRPGAAYVDLPADYIQAVLPTLPPPLPPVEPPPKILGDPARISAIASALRCASAPLIIVGKGAAYARAEKEIRQFVEATAIPFLPTPQGKGVLADSHPLNTSACRSAALKNADFILLLGARVNWILHFGTRFSPTAKISQVDIAAEELGRNGTDSSLSVIGDIGAVITQLSHALGTYRLPAHLPFRDLLAASAHKNTASAAAKESAVTRVDERLSYHRTFALANATLQRLAASPDDLVFVSEGANTMDISRGIFPLSQPRQKLDAGTYATMGVGLGYAIAAEIAHNHNAAAASSGMRRKRVIAIEGDSAIGFSLAELETMARYRLPVIVLVMNNGGVYHGISDDADPSYSRRWTSDLRREAATLPSTALSYETEYHKVAEGLGARGYRVRSEAELVRALEEAWASSETALVDVVMRSGAGGQLSFGWLEKKEEAKL
jgi:2-hydroxyacyl-CoA lyase 1